MTAGLEALALAVLVAVDVAWLLWALVAVSRALIVTPSDKPVDRGNAGR